MNHPSLRWFSTYVLLDILFILFLVLDQNFNYWAINTSFLVILGLKFFWYILLFTGSFLDEKNN